MKILLISPWKNVWMDYFKKYFEARGHTFDCANRLVVKDIPNYDVLISGWADAGVKWLSHHDKLCPTYICWVRSYELWHHNMDSIDWSKFDKVLFTNSYFMNMMNLPQGAMLHNAIDLDRIVYKRKRPGKEVLFLADLNFKKGIPLLMQVAQKLPDYNFRIYGNVDSKRDYLYLRYYNLPNLFVCDYEKNINALFDRSNYILLTSPVEGNPNCIIEGMAAGLKPVIHRFIGSEKQFPESCYWNTIDDAVRMIKSKTYYSSSYRKWIETYYDMWKVYPALEKIICSKEKVYA